MLSGRLRAAFLNRTGRFLAAISLEEKFCTFAAAQAAPRFSIPSQSFLPPVSNTDGKVYRPRSGILNSQFPIRGPSSFRSTSLPFVDFHCLFQTAFANRQWDAQIHA